MATVEAYRRNDFMCLGNRNIKTRLTRMKPTAIRSWYLLSDFDSGSFIVNNIFSKGIRYILNYQKYRIFGLSSNHRATTPEPKGFYFLSPPDRRCCSYRDKPKGIQSPVIGLDTVKSNAVFYCSFLNLSTMSKTITSGTATQSVIGVPTPEEILHDLLTTDEISKMRQHLRDMLDAYLLDEDDSKYRHDIYSTYMALDILLTRIENLTLNTIAA